MNRNAGQGAQRAGDASGESKSPCGEGVSAASLCF